MVRLDDFFAGILFLIIFFLGIYGGWIMGTKYKPMVDMFTNGKF